MRIISAGTSETRGRDCIKGDLKTAVMTALLYGVQNREFWVRDTRKTDNEWSGRARHDVSVERMGFKMPRE